LPHADSEMWSDFITGPTKVKVKANGLRNQVTRVCEEKKWSHSGRGPMKSRPE
jgi:hypothetical protein